MSNAFLRFEVSARALSQGTSRFKWAVITFEHIACGVSLARWQEGFVPGFNLP
jgi:hypothetical protein